MKTASSLFGWIGRGLLKILKFLLLRLGLWVPVAYSLLFVIVTAVTRTSFSAVWGVYVFGLCVTCVFAVALACLGFMHRADRKSSAAKRSSGYVQGMTPVDNNVQYGEGAQDVLELGVIVGPGVLAEHLDGPGLEARELLAQLEVQAVEVEAGQRWDLVGAAAQGGQGKGQ